MRERSEKRNKAFEIWVRSGKTIKLKDISKELDVCDTQIRKWKFEDKWDSKSKEYNPNNVRFPGKARWGNKFAVGNNGGAPLENKNNEKFGFFSKILSEDALELAKEISIKTPLDILWDNITLQYAAIARAQGIMYVKDRNDRTKETTKVKETENTTEESFEIQQAWDKQSNFMQAQARAMGTLRSLIKQYDEQLRTGLATEEQELRIQKLKYEVNKLNKVDDKKDIEALSALSEEELRSLASYK